MASVVSPVRRYRGVSRDDRRTQRRDRLLRAAITVYGDVGYRNATVKAVCAAAGLTERYFYESFANSEALLIAAYKVVNRLLVDEIASVQAAAAGGPADKLQAGLAHYFAALQRDRTLARVFLMELPGVSEAADRAHGDTLEMFALMLVRMLDPDGTRDDAPRALLARGVVSGIFGIAVRWIGGDYAEPVALPVQAAWRLCLVLQPQA